MPLCITSSFRESNIEFSQVLFPTGSIEAIGGDSTELANRKCAIFSREDITFICRDGRK